MRAVDDNINNSASLVEALLVRRSDKKNLLLTLYSCSDDVLGTHFKGEKRRRIYKDERPVDSPWIVLKGTDGFTLNIHNRNLQKSKNFIYFILVSLRNLIMLENKKIYYYF